MLNHRPVVHLVGSIPLKNSETVFLNVSSKLGDYLCRLPDGETGKRIGWIKFLQDYLNNEHLDMETDKEAPPLEWRQWDGLLLREVPMAKFKEGVNPKTVTFNTGYAEAGIKSFATFERLQSAGSIPKNIKFQICIPTPLAPAYNFVSPPAQDDFIPVYTDHIIDEVSAIARELPNDQICIQWDVCQEVLMWEQYYDYERPGYKEEIFLILGKIGNAVPEPIELGYHLCYGSPKDEHLVQPKDTSNMVEMAQGILSNVRRTIQFFHFPVPKNREDGAYYKPLEKLNLPQTTDLYLGLVHYNDELGNKRRLKKASMYVQVDGIGSECGWGRANTSRVPGQLLSHAKLMEVFNEIS